MWKFKISKILIFSNQILKLAVCLHVQISAISSLNSLKPFDKMKINHLKKLITICFIQDSGIILKTFTHLCWFFVPIFCTFSGSYCNTPAYKVYCCSSTKYRSHPPPPPKKKIKNKKKCYYFSHPPTHTNTQKHSSYLLSYTMIYLAMTVAVCSAVIFRKVQFRSEPNISK